MSHGSARHRAKHFFYAAGWKKFESLWTVAVRARQLGRMTPLLEAVLSKLTGASGSAKAAGPERAIPAARGRHDDAADLNQAHGRISS